MLIRNKTVKAKLCLKVEVGMIFFSCYVVFAHQGCIYLTNDTV